MVHEDYKEMIPARALSALDQGDDRALMDHLAECAECRRELADWEATCAGLSLEASPLEPSARLRESILSSVRVDSASGAETPSRPAQILPFVAPRRTAWNSPRSFGAVAAALVLVALLAAVIMLWWINRTTQNQLVALSTQMKTAEEQLNQERKVIEHMTSPGTRMAELMPTTNAPNAKAMLAYDTAGHAMLLARGLPAAPAGKAYQLWYIVGNKPMPGRVFSMDKSGTGMLEDQMPAAAMNAAVFAITLEPSSGVEAPTGAILLMSRT